MAAQKIKDPLRAQLVAYLTQGHAHDPFEKVMKDFPMDRINDLAPNTDYTPWRLLEHIRISQKDILEFMRDPKYSEKYSTMKWPDDYWPKEGEKGTPASWKKSVKACQDDMADLIAFIADPKIDLFQKIKWGSGQTILKEILVVLDHNSYHIGEFGILRSVMKTW